MRTAERQQQIRESLDRAQTIRMVRANTKRQVREGIIGVMAAVQRPEAATELVVNVLQWQHRWGPSRAANTIRLADIGYSVRCGELTARQITRLSRVLRGEPVESWEDTVARHEQATGAAA